MSTSATTRRTLAMSAVWAAPVVAMAVAAPAAAASGDCTGCWTLNWDDPATGTASFLANVSPDPALSTSFNKDWTRTGSLTAPAAGGGCPALTASVAQKRISGSYKGLTSTTRTNTDSDFSIGNTGRLANTGETPSTIDTDGVMGLVLNQATTVNASTAAEEGVIFTFSAPVQTVSFKIYDFTRNTATGINNYADSVSFDKPTTVTDATAPGSGNERHLGFSREHHVHHRLHPRSIGQHQWAHQLRLPQRSLPDHFAWREQPKRRRCCHYGWSD
ncbi:MAG: hypothetical protein V9E81_03390 [Marmoricola sp.]